MWRPHFSRSSTPATPTHGVRLPWLRLFTVSLIAIFSAGFIFVLYFLYQSVFTVINQVDAVLILQSNIRVEVIDFERFEKVDRAWKQKTASPDILIARDPFSPVAVSSSTTKPVAPDQKRR